MATKEELTQELSLKEEEIGTEVEAEMEVEIDVAIGREEETSTENLANQLVKDFGEFDPTLELSNFRFPTFNLLKQYGSVPYILQIEKGLKNKVLNDFIKFVQNRPEYEGRLLEITTKISADSSVKPASGMAQYYLEIGDKAEALSLFKSSLKNNPDDFKTIKNIVLIQIDLELFAEAIEFSTKMVEFFPTQPILYLANGVANNQMQFYQEALGALEIGIDYVIDNKIMEIDFYKQLSISHRYLNNIKQSQSFSKKAEALLNGQ